MTLSPKTFWTGLVGVTFAAGLLFAVALYPRDIAFEEKIAAAAERLDAVQRATRGTELYRANKLRAAEAQMQAALKKAEELSESRPGWHFKLAGIQYELGEYEAALEAVDRSLELTPGIHAYRNTRGAILMKQGRFPEAEAEFDAIIEEYPDWILAYLNRAAARYQLGKFDEALADATYAIDKVDRPRQASLGYQIRGAIRARRDQLAEAEADFTVVVEGAEEAIDAATSPSAVRVWNETLSRALYNRSIVRERMGRPVGAQRDRARADAILKEPGAKRATATPAT